MITEFVKLKPNEVKLIETYCVENFDNLKSIFKKLIDYTNDVKFSIITKEEIQLFNNIPIHKKYKLEIPITIYRGLNVSNNMFEKIISKKQFTYKPKKQFSSWSLNKKTAKFYSTGVTSNKEKGLIIESTLKSKLNLQINLLYFILENLNYYYDTNEPKTLIQKKLLEFSYQNTHNYKSEEVLIFGKLPVTNISKTK